jgi:hypothetical protein
MSGTAAGTAALIDAAFLAGKAIRLLGSKHEVQRLAVNFDPFETVLARYLGPVLNLDRQVRCLEHGGRKVKNLCQLSRRQPVLYVVRRPRLKQASYGLPARTAAIDKIFLDAPNLCDVEVVWNELAARQYESHVGIATRFEQWN